MTLKIIAAPTVEPVTLDEAKAELRVEHSVDDALIADRIAMAREQAEHATCRALITQTWERVLDLFPSNAIELGRPPVQSIVSVKYIDPDGIEQTLSPTLYSLDADTSPGWLLPAADTDWPATRDAVNVVRVRFICGYGAAGSAVPMSIRQFIKAHLVHWYRNRSAVSEKRLEPSPYVERLLDAYRVWL